MDVLVVEPAKLYHKILGKTLQDIGCTFSIVESGGDAISQLEQKHFDLVCASMQLPDMNGSQLTMRVRAMEHGAVIPVVILTASDSDETREEAYVGGVTHVFHRQHLDDLQEYLKKAASTQNQGDPKDGHILYLEDSISVAKMTIAMLESKNMKVDHFTNAEEALEAFRRESYDLVLTDILLEGRMTGQDLLREIKDGHDVKRTIPILAVTGFNDQARKIELLRNGASDYVHKPVLAEELWARVRNLVVQSQLLKQIEEQQNRLETMAITDQLTGLYNRHFLMENIEEEVGKARVDHRPLSLLIADIDNFRVVNESHGHHVGDEVLKSFGELIWDTCEEIDTPARFGGEEFIVLLPGSDTDDAVQRAEELCTTFAERYPAGIAVTASFGVSTLDLSEEDGFTSMFKAADEALLHAKRSGRNCVIKAA